MRYIADRVPNIRNTARFLLKFLAHNNASLFRTFADRYRVCDVQFVDKLSLMRTIDATMRLIRQSNCFSRPWKLDLPVKGWK